MGYIGDGEVGMKNGHGIAEDEVFVSVENPFLTVRQVIEAKKTWTIGWGLSAHGGKGAPDPSRVVLEENGKTIAAKTSHPDLFQRLVTVPKFAPRLTLFR